jgi:hypothetical protein
MAARFGHHIALVRNMGEEIANDKDECEMKDREEPENSRNKVTAATIREYSNNLRSVDPYGHPIALQTGHLTKSRFLPTKPSSPMEKHFD